MTDDDEDIYTQNIDNLPAAVALNTVMWRLAVALKLVDKGAAEFTASLNDILVEVEERLWILDDLRDDD